MADPPVVSISLTGLDDEGAGRVEEWYFPPRPVFLGSHAFDVLRREMRRYLDGEIQGRSFLIAGHRGAGKTAMVLRAASDLYQQAIEQAVHDVAQGADVAISRGTRLGPPTRPLLVQLSGFSLVAAETPASEAKAADPGTATAAQATAPADGNAAPPGPVADPAASAPAEARAGDIVNRSAERALQHLTTVLYRALAREVSECFARHARTIDRKPPDGMRRLRDLPELAGQVTLDLDQAPDVATLRAAWHRLDRLASGVLWPATVGHALGAGGLRDRGVREIMALATANEAFQVCIGDINDKRINKANANQEQTLKAEAKADAKDFASRLLGLLAGGVTGAALWGPGREVTAVAAGGAVAAVSTLALTWTSTRSRKSERGLDYTIVIKRTIENLERDLPLVIQRIRDAGLAPVFVIDELDKVSNTGRVIHQIISRLKNLTTDYGFFCFLTGREYFDEIEGKIRVEAYPNEHTYFSHRLLVLYRPEELSHFVRQLWALEPAGGPLPASGPEAVDLMKPAHTAAWVLTSGVLHRARLSTIDVMRELAALVDRDGKLRDPIEDVRASGRFLLPMVVQLVIEHLLRRPALADRMRDNPAFTQRAIDAAYFISHTWQTAEAVTVDEAHLRAHLVRQGRIAGEDDDRRQQVLDSMVSGEQRTVLLRLVEDMAELLTEPFVTIQARLAADPVFQSSGGGGLPEREREKLSLLLPLLSSMPGQSQRLLARDDPGKPEYRFLYDNAGLDRMVAAMPAPAGPGLPKNQSDALALVDDLRAVLTEYGLTLNQMMQIGVLPDNVPEARIAGAADALRTAASGPVAAHPEEASILLGFAETARRWSRAIVTFVALVDLVRDDAKRALSDASAILRHQALPDAATTLRILGRMLPIASIASRLAGEATRAEAPEKRDLSANLMPALEQILTPEIRVRSRNGTGGRLAWKSGVTSEKRRLGRARGSFAAQQQTLIRDAEHRWDQRFETWFGSGGREVGDPIGYPDLVLGITDPSVFLRLRPDLNLVTAWEWSDIAARLFSQAANENPPLVQAALRALGFGRRILGTDPLPSGTAIASTGPEDQPGLVFVARPQTSIAHQPQGGPRKGRPILVISSPPSEESTRLLEWLAEHDAIDMDDWLVEDEQE